MTVEEAMDFFKSVPQILKKLITLKDVGLSYIKLGQAANTLSGGEAQRVKLSKELSKRDTGKTLYILDEPTTGLHFSDIQMLMDVLNSLVSKGNSVLVIEHNLDVIKCADWIIDLGPEGGDGGGNIVAEGNISNIKKNKTLIQENVKYLRNLDHQFPLGSSFLVVDFWLLLSCWFFGCSFLWCFFFCWFFGCSFLLFLLLLLVS